MSLGAMFVATVMAEDARPTDGPWWIPAAASLLGTLVGGLITYFTTTVANQRAQEAEHEQQRVALIREVSIRFIQAVSKQSIASMNLNQLSTGIKAALEKVSDVITQGGDPKEVIEEFRKAAGQIIPAASQGGNINQLDMFASMMDSLGGAHAGISETSVLLAEMRLLLPNRILDIAATVTTLHLLQQLTAALPVGKKIEPGHVNQVLNLFTNSVRAEMGLDKYTPPENLTLKDLPQKIKDLEAEMQ